MPWEFNPQHVGRALVGGGWVEMQSIGTVNGSPEFTFPLQLVYLNSRAQRGLFGDQWFCPQLESNVLPRQKGILVWQTPSGGLIGLRSNPREPTKFADPTGNWQAKLNGSNLVIKNGEGWQYVYTGGRMSAVVSPAGRELDFTYGGRNLAQVTLRATGASQVVIASASLPDGKVASLDVCGVQRFFAYGNGSNGRLQAIQQSGTNAAITFTYDRNGVLAVEQPLRGPLITFATAEPRDKHGLMMPVPNGSGPPQVPLTSDNLYQYTYKGNTVRAENAQGAALSVDYAANRGVQNSTDAAGNQTQTFYFRAPGQKYDGKVRRVVENGDVAADYQYSKETGSLIESKDKDGLLTFYQYAQAPKGLESSPQYAKPVRIYQGTRKLAKLVATLQYDAAGNLIQQTDGKGKTTRFSYDGGGDLIAVVDPAGTRTVITCDPFGRRIGIAKGSQQEGVAYDDNGRIKSRQMPDGQLAEFAYDAQGNVQTVSQNGVTVARYVRDSNGDIIGQADALGRATRLDRDGFGHIIAVAHPNGSTTRYEYDSAGHRAAQIDGDQNRITFEYDQAGHVVKQTNALGQVLTWVYDAKGHVIQRTNGVQTITYQYDDAGRLVLLDYGKIGEKLKYAYDAKGRVKKVASPTNSLTFFYDADGHVAAEQFIRGQACDRVIRYGYDANGRKASVVLSEREMSEVPAKNEPPAYRLIQQTEYAYDQDGHLVEVKSNGATACDYRYDARGRLASRTYGDGITGVYAYDAFGHQTRLDLSGGPLVSPLSLVYDWDAAGQMTSRQWNGETQVYSYDASGQLLTVATPASTASPASQAAAGASASDYRKASNPPSAAANILESYSYDAAGNMLEKYEEGVRTVMTYDAGNELKTATVRGIATAFAYDNAGRLLSDFGPDAKTREYGFQDKVLVLTKPGGIRIGYDYYPDGQLAAKGPLQSGSRAGTSAGEKTGVSLADQLSALKETDSDLEQSDTQKAMGITEEFLWDGLALLYRNGETYAVEPHPNGGIPIAATNDPQSDTRTYFINDIIGTTLAVIHPDGIEIVPLTAFGKPRTSNLPSALKPEVPKISTENGSL